MDNRTILIADDSPLQAIILRRILTQAKFSILTAKDGNEAIAQLKANRAHLVISDVNMPNMDGYELCRQIKANPEFGNIPVILCTVLSSPEDLIRGVEAGADSYITRPYNEGQLLALVNELLMPAPPKLRGQEKEEIRFEGKTYNIGASRQEILNFLLSTYRNVHQQNMELIELREELKKAYGQLESVQKDQEQLLHDILPQSVATELIAYGSAEPARFEQTSVMFVDFAGFSKSAALLTPQNLVRALEYYFDQFDKIIESFHLEKIKILGDGYMCVGGVPIPDSHHAYHAILAALQIRKFVIESIPSMNEKYGIQWQVRIGIHSGPVVAGVIGKKHLAYDIWGDTVNIASRMESHGIVGEINVSASTYEQVKDLFVFESRGNLPIRNKTGVERYMDMYLVKGIKT